MKTHWKFVVLAALIEAGLVAIGRLGDLRYQAPATVAILLLTQLLYLVSVWLVLNYKSLDFKGLTWVVGAAALAFRLTAWPLAPQLSDDIFRYRWEGKLQAHGGNPYQVRPTDQAWAHLRDSAHDRITGRDFKTSYGPLIELQERATWHLVAAFTGDPARQIHWFKLPAALADLAVIAALALLLRARGLPAALALVYAWSPLPVMEFWATGHNDALTLLPLVLALLAAARGRWVWAFTALALAAATKLWPLALFPLFIGWKDRRPRRWWQWTVSLPIFAALLWPYRSDLVENVRFVSGFLGGWRNNDSLFGGLLGLTGDPYRAKYAAFAIVGATALALTLKRWPLERAALWTIAAMLMVSSNVHPWYLTWLLPLLAFCPSTPLLLWTALAPLSYRVLIEWALLGEWHGSTPDRWLIYVPVYGLLVWNKLRRPAVVK